VGAWQRDAAGLAMATTGGDLMVDQRDPREDEKPETLLYYPGHSMVRASCHECDWRIETATHEGADLDVLQEHHNEQLATHMREKHSDLQPKPEGKP
jgi:hypothetical protein